MSKLEVEVAYALPDRQWLKVVMLAEGDSVADALAASGIAAVVEEAILQDAVVGIWGKQVTRSTRVKSGDRVEVYRPLSLDPREARRQLAMLGQTMNSVTPK